jgi:hypothetical protein
MVKKLLYNTFLNLGIIVLLYSAFVSFNQQQYGILVAAVLGLAVLIYLKAKMLKQIRKIKE